MLFVRFVFIAVFLLKISPAAVCAQTAESEDPSSSAQSPQQSLDGMAMLAGEVTDTSALVQIRLTQNNTLVDRDVVGQIGVVEFALRAEDDPATVLTETARALPQRDFIARVRFGGLRPNTNYHCDARIGLNQSSLSEGPSLRFKTHPGPSQSQPVSFVVVTGTNYAKFHGDGQAKLANEGKRNGPKPYTGPDKHLGYPALQTIRKLKPDFFVGTGDNVYYDRPASKRAKRVSEMRQKWHEQFIQPRFRDLFATVPTFWMVDDHDYRIDDCDNSEDYLPLPKTAQQILLEQLPYALAGEWAAKTYRTHRVSKDLQIWMPENRFYRSPNKMPDGPAKSIWGDQQCEWLKQTLLASDATYKILISPTPMVGPDDLRKKDNHCNIGGFRHERDVFFKFLETNGLDQENFFIVCGDRHWQYHAVDSSGIEEFSCGALVDANSRLGVKPGDPSGTDPEGLIKQIYTQDKRSGGFLMIRSQPAGDDGVASLSFEFHDEQGVLLHRCMK